MMAEQDTPSPTITTMKIPIIKKEEYDIWSTRMRQYICHTDHNLWDIIVDGDLQEEAAPTGEQSGPPAPKTAKQLTAKRNHKRVKSILLLAIPDECLLKFHNVLDAKSLWAAIKSTLDKAYDRFQKLISQLELHAAPILKEDINQKFLRSLPPSWSQIALIMRNKPNIDQTDIDDLYNNLRVYEDEMKRSSSSTSNSQNLAILSFENTSRTNEVSTVSGNFGVNTARGTSSTSQGSSTPGADEVIDQDDLEELDIRWQVAMMTVRVQRFIQKTGRNLDFKGIQPIIFDKSKVVCYNCHKKGHFSKECKSGRNQGKRSYGGYDWSNDFDEPVNYALMAISSSSSSSSSDNEGYELALESLEFRILGHEKNELAWGEKYKFQNYELKCRELKINNLKMELEKVVKERDELKVKIEKWEESSKGLNKILNSQMSAKDKNGLGYGTQMNEMSNKSKTDSEIRVLTRTGLVIPVRPNGKRAVHTVSTARPISTARQFAPKIAQTGSAIRPIYPRMDNVRPRASYSPIRRSYYTKPDFRPKNLKQDVKTSGIRNMTTAGTRAVVNTGKGKMENNLKKSRAPRKDDVYSLDLKNIVPSGGITCLYANATSDESKLWHRRLGHANFKNINKLVKGHLVRGLPSKVFVNDYTCVACKKGKQHKASCKAKLERTIRNPLELLHMDLFGPVSVESINKKKYCLVVTDDFSRFSWVFFLATKDETSKILYKFIIGLENQLNHNVKIIRYDNGTEFKNHAMNELCAKKGIKREFSVARTPSQNGVTKKKNRTLIEAARTMLADSLLPIPFWTEAVNTACYVLNRVLVTKPQNKTPYELLIGKSPSISFMRPFGCPLTNLNTLDSLGKFNGKSNEGYLLGYSTTSKAFRVYNKRTKRVEENLHIDFLEDQPNVAGTGPNWMFDLDFLTNSMNYILVSVENQVNVDAGTQDSYVLGSSGKDKESTQEYILLPLHPHRTRISIEDVAPATHEKSSKSSPKENDVQDSEDVADKEEQHQMTEDEQVLHDELDKMIA
ncbi:putative ribonuclease H-like domain-containing protein [Tanacetum coccineum]|uniref:Ribonuclease H-like domain-containing protein n=1 Tax=Tanacetum coccineum TaxID=301880 RepID=A0ABQ5D9Y8_9ASTR